MKMADIKGTVHCNFPKKPLYADIVTVNSVTGEKIVTKERMKTATDNFTEWVSKLPFDLMTDYPLGEDEISFSLLRYMCSKVNKKGTYRVKRINRSIIRLS